MSEIYGDSLADVGIKDGDYVLIHLTKNVSEGDLVAATTPAGFLVKFLSYAPNGNICLTDSDYIPRCFPSESVYIEGRIVRKL